jgi:hypothetical protein
LFLGTGASYYAVLWTPPQGGNAFFILAHQYIAAEMNMLAGATMPSEVSDAFSAAAGLLTTYQGSMEIPKKTEDRDSAISLADTLDDYNNGLIGPGHCGSCPVVSPRLECLRRHAGRFALPARQRAG